MRDCAADIQRALDERRTIKSIAEELGISVESVRYRISRLGLTRPGPKKTEMRRVRVVPQPPVHLQYKKPASALRSKRRERPCICCGSTFKSVGPQHRMCVRCRPLSQDHVYSIGASKK